MALHRPSWRPTSTARSRATRDGRAPATASGEPAPPAATWARPRRAPTFARGRPPRPHRHPKVLYPKYFYDELGSLLFEAITALPEYYPTRAEAEILRAHAGEIAAALGGPVWLLELGSGDGQKTRLLIEALLARQGTLEYVPVDISESAVEASSRSLLFSYPELRITAYVGEYQAALRSDPGGAASPPGRTLVLFLGSTLGNLDPEERRALLRDVRALLDPGEGFLLGVDLKKSESVLLPAYDDALGVTAAFNLNLLVRINRELGGEFDLAAFRHRARLQPARRGGSRCTWRAAAPRRWRSGPWRSRSPSPRGRRSTPRAPTSSTATDRGPGRGDRLRAAADVDGLGGAVRVEPAGGGRTSGGF